MARPVVLVVEDGDEYTENLRRVLPETTVLQAHNSAEAQQVLSHETVALVVLDMRFDRIPRQQLSGDHTAIVTQHGGDSERAWRHLERYQGLYILEALRQAELSELPILLAHDLSTQPTRLAHLQRRHPTLRAIADPAQLRPTIETLLELKSLAK